MRLRGNSRLFRQVISDENLTEAWHRVRSQRSKTAGVDGVTLEQFQRHLFREMRKLQLELETGRYEPQPAKLAHIPKRKGGERPIAILTVRDRVAQWAVLNVVGPILDMDFEDTSFGYRPGRSPDMALERVAQLANDGLTWAVHLDIEDCFGNIPVHRLYRIIRRKIRDRRICALIHRWLHLETVQVRGRGVVHRKRHHGLLQGSPLSPLFANLYLDQLDKMARKKRLQMVRYADDILVLCRTRPEAEEALKLVHKFLLALGLRLNPAKTSISKLEEGFSFLGGTLGYRPGDKNGPWVPLFPKGDGHDIRD